MEWIVLDQGLRIPFCRDAAKSKLVVLMAIVFFISSTLFEDILHLMMLRSPYLQGVRSS